MLERAALFNRMSALVRRRDDTRAQFAQSWRNHAAFIAGLPGVRRYVQNHVIETFASTNDPPLRADGFVELQFDSSAAMDLAFASPAARKMAADEPNFLGHGSGYALRQEYSVRTAEDGQKLIIAVVEGLEQEVSRLEALLDQAASADRVRCDVQRLIGKPAMAPPQPVRTFFHVLTEHARASHALGIEILSSPPAAGLALAAFQVRTLTIV